MKITKVSKLTGIEHTREIAVTEEELSRIGGEEFIQDIVPHLSADDREFLMTGVTPEEWDEAFPEDDYEDDEDNIAY